MWDSETMTQGHRHPETIPRIEAIVMIILLILLIAFGFLVFPYQ